MHGLRLKGFAEAPVVAEIVGLDEGVASEHLDALATEGLVQYRDGRLSGYSLTSAGRGEHERLLGEELDAAGVRSSVRSCYEQFLELNADLLRVCTAWQLRDVNGQSVVNDHKDATYDKDVIERLCELDEKVQPICDSLGDALDRLAGYGLRLREALSKVQSGEVEFFTKPMIASYHTVWFELHEDLLATLGLERASEGSPA
jgi:hypothetical protein